MIRFRFWMLIFAVVILKALPAAGQVSQKETPYGLSDALLSQGAMVSTLPLEPGGIAPGR